MKKLFGLCMFLLSPYFVISQKNDATLQNKYWVYRDIFRKQFVKIGPEPGESLTIDYYDRKYSGGCDQSFMIIVTDVLGKTVYSAEINPREDGKYLHVIPLGDQANGMYSVQVSSDGFNHSSKVVLIK